MDMITITTGLLALFGLVAFIAGVESRDGFENQDGD